jgi:hypothetical protein
MLGVARLKNVTGAQKMAKLPTISTGSFERLRRGRGLGLGLVMAAALGAALVLYFLFGR